MGEAKEKVLAEFLWAVTEPERPFHPTVPPKRACFTPVQLWQEQVAHSLRFTCEVRSVLNLGSKGVGRTTKLLSHAEQSSGKGQR